jgi:hypothetical protein
VGRRAGQGGGESVLRWRFGALVSQPACWGACVRACLCVCVFALLRALAQAMARGSCPGGRLAPTSQRCSVKGVRRQTPSAHKATPNKPLAARASSTSGGLCRCKCSRYLWYLCALRLTAHPESRPAHLRGLFRRRPARYGQTMTANMFLKRVNTRAMPSPCAPRHLKIAPIHGLHQRKSIVGGLSRRALGWLGLCI